MPRSALGGDGLTREEGGSNGRHRRVSFDDEKASLLQLGAGSNSNTSKGAEARDFDNDTGMMNGGTFAPVDSVPLMPLTEQQQHNHHTARKPSISIVDGYNSPVRRGGPRNKMELDEEAAGGMLVSGLGGSGSGSCGIFHHHHGENGGHGHHHDHCVIARREVEQAEDLSNKVRFAVHASICANVFLSIVSAYAAIRSGSLAVLASLVDTLLDLISQVVLSVAEQCMRKPSDEHYPAGRSRIEPVGVIIVSVIMGVAALELLRASVGTMVMALAYGKLPHLGEEEDGGKGGKGGKEGRG